MMLPTEIRNAIMVAGANLCTNSQQNNVNLQKSCLFDDKSYILFKLGAIKWKFSLFADFPPDLRTYCSKFCGNARALPATPATL